MTGLQPMFSNITLAFDDSLIIQTHKVMLVTISTVSEGLQSKHPNQHPLFYMRGGTSTQFEDQKGKRIG